MLTHPGLMLLAVALLASCGDTTSRQDAGRPTVGGDQPLTPRALAAVVAEHTGTPSSATRGYDMDELGERVAAEVELSFGAGAKSDGDRLSVGVGTAFERTIKSCASLMTEYAGCEETVDGIVFWENQTPGEDPGVVYVMASKGDTDVLFFYVGPAITGDPQDQELPIPVEDMFAIAADPRVDVTTSTAAVEAGEDIAFWSGES